MEAGGYSRLGRRGGLAPLVALSALFCACVPSLSPSRRDRAVDRPGWPGLEAVASVDGTGRDAAPPDRSRDTRPVIPDRPPPAPDLYLGAWYQVPAPVHCQTFCNGKGLQNPKSPEGCHCTSGENRPASAIAAGIKYPYGCTGGGCGSVTGICPTFSDEVYCYHNGQKVDDDATDLTVACFCR